MAFMKNINDLIGTLTLMVLMLPSIAANIDCNGKPFYCVNSTHFLICVDHGNGVCRTIDDFVIPCPPTTVCQGTNRFECEFPAVTTTTLTSSVVPTTTSVSESTGTVTATLYEVSTSIPFEEYFNTLRSTTLSEDALIAQQVIAFESEMIIPESSPTLNENISSALQNVFTTQTPLLDSKSASATELIPDIKENASLIMSRIETGLNLNETVPNVAVPQNDFTVTINTIFNNATQNTKVIPPAGPTTLNETITNVIVVQNVFTTHTPYLYSVTANAVNLISDVTENASAITPESEANFVLNETISSVDVLRNDHAITTITPLTNATQNFNVITARLESSSTLNETISSVYTVHNALIADNPLFQNISSSATDPISDVTENISVIPRFGTDLILNKTISSIRRDLTNSTLISLSNNISANVTDLIANTEDVNVIEAGYEPNSTRITNNINDNATDLIPDVTENVNIFISNANLPNKTIQRPTNTGLNDTVAIYTLRSTSLTNNLADTVIESILTKLAENTSSVSINVIQNLTTNNTPIKTALPDKIVDIIFSERIVNEVTDSINVTKSKSNTTVGENNLVGAVEQNNVTTILTLNSKASFSNLEKNTTEPVKPAFNSSMVKTKSSKSDDLVQNDLRTQKPFINTFLPTNILTEATSTSEIENINVTSAESNRTVDEFTTSMPVATKVIEHNFTILKILNITLPSSITTPIVNTMTPNLNLTKESINKTITTESDDIVLYYDVTISNSSGIASLNSTYDVTESVIDVDIKNTNDTQIESDLNQASRESLLSESEKLNYVSPLYTQSTTSFMLNKTELVSTDNILNSLRNEIYKSNTGNNDSNVSGNKNTSYMNSSATSENYKASSMISIITKSSDIIDFVETTSNSILETAQSKEVAVVTYSDVNTDKVDIVDDQEIIKATNQTKGNTKLSQALTTGTVEHKVLTPAFTVTSTNHNIFMNSLISITDAPLSNPPEVTSGSTFEYDKSSLRNRKNDNKTLSSNGTTALFQIENGSELAVNTTSLEFVQALEKHEEPVYSIEAILLPSLPTEASADNILEKPGLYESHFLTATNSSVMSTKLPIVIDHVNETKTIEQTTLATISTITETTQPSYLEKSNNTTASKIAKTEPAVLNDTSRLKDAVSITNISKIISDSSNSFSFNKSTNINQPSKEEVMLRTVNTEIIHAKSSVPVLQLTTEVTASEVVKNSHVELPLNIKRDNDKTSNSFDFTQKTLSSLLVNNNESEILTVGNNISELTTNASNANNQEFEIIPLLNTAQQETLNIITPELITSSIQTEHPVLNLAKIEATKRTLGTVTELFGNTMIENNLAGEYSATSVTKPYPLENKIDLTAANGDVNVLMEDTLSTVSISMEAAKENNPLLNLLLNSQVKQRSYNAPTLSNTKILLEPTSIQEKLKTSFTNILPPSGTTTQIPYILVKPARVGNSSQNTMPLNSQTSQEVDISSQKEITKNTSVTLNQNVITIQNKDYFNTPTTESISKPGRATTVTKSLQITSQSIAEQSVIELTSTEPYTKSPKGSGNNLQTANRPNEDYMDSNPETQYINVPQYNTIIFNIKAVGVKSLTGLSTNLSTITQTTKMSVQTTSKPDLNNITLQEELNHSKNKMGDTKSKQLIMPDHLGSNSNAVHVVKTNGQILELENNLLTTSTHSGISVIPKPTEKSNVDLSNKLKRSESVEKLASEKEKEIGSETIIYVPNNVTPAISTTVSAVYSLKYSKPGPDLVNEQNINARVDLTRMLQTVDYRLPLTNNKSSSETISEMTNKKPENGLDRSYEPITDTELLSLTTVTSTEHIAHEEVAHVLLPKEMLDESINITANITSNVSSNNENSTARSTPLVKSPIAKTHNDSLTHFTALESATNSNNFVCKPSNRGRFSDSKDCRKFYICIGRHIPIEGFCPNNTVFSELRKQCTKNLSHCIRNNQFQCIWEGRFSDYLNDNIYYICVKNNVGTFRRFKLQCQSGYHLNKTSVRCVLNTKSFQSSSQQSTSDISNTKSTQFSSQQTSDISNTKSIRSTSQQSTSDISNTKSIQSTSQQSTSDISNTKSVQSTSQQSTSDISKHSSDQSVFPVKNESVDAESSEKFECEKRGKFPDENDCRKYYICTKIGKSKYRLKIKKCDSDELFHKSNKKCVDADSYECS